MENRVKNNPSERYVSFLYYMTNIKNLHSIMRGGILSYDRARKGNKIPTSISNPGVQELRERILIKLTEKETKRLHDFVPLYFTPKTPMLYKIQNDEIAFLEIDRSIMNEKGVIFTDGNAAVQGLKKEERDKSNKKTKVKVNVIHEAGRETEEINMRYFKNQTTFYSGIENLEKLDWSVINAEWWYNNEDSKEEQDRKRRCRQAEALVPIMVPPEYFKRVCVINESIRNKVLPLLEDMPFNIDIIVKPSFYF